MLKLYAQNDPNHPLEVSGYVPDVQALRGAAWFPASCTYLCVWVKLYEVSNPRAYPANQQGRFLKLWIVGRRNLLLVSPGDLTYAEGTVPGPADPPFQVRAAETYP
jgi:hypothetical protein